MTVVTDSNRVDELLAALAEQLAADGEPIELVVIGGSALLALGLIERATRDVDVVALLPDGDLVRPDPLPDWLVRARDRVARDFALPRDWLNAAPRSLLDFGLPTGFVDRLEHRRYGDFLTVHFRKQARPDPLQTVCARRPRSWEARERPAGAAPGSRRAPPGGAVGPDARPLGGLPAGTGQGACVPRGEGC